jgi:hypothetical protein
MNRYCASVCTIVALCSLNILTVLGMSMGVAGPIFLIRLMRMSSTIKVPVRPIPALKVQPLKGLFLLFG